MFRLLRTNPISNGTKTGKTAWMAPDEKVAPADGNSLADWFVPVANDLDASLTMFIIRDCCEGRAMALDVVKMR